jgi:serine protease Do
MMMRKLVVYLLVSGIIFVGSVVNAKTLPQLFKQVNPSVVVVQTKEHGYSKHENSKLALKEGIGSGVVISKDGLILTAAHVVQVADVVNVKFLDGGTFSATVIGSAVFADVALIKLDHVPENISVAKLGDSDNIAVGDNILVIGAPYGVEHTLTVGHISGRRKPKGFSNQFISSEFLQTDAAINMGNSGGPMFNMQGEVIGIVSHMLSHSGGYEGLGFAASINTAKGLLLDSDSFWTGLECFMLTGELAKAFNLPQDAGLLVQRVASKSMGFYLELKPGKIPALIHGKEILIGGDIVLDVQGKKISEDLETMQEIRIDLIHLSPKKLIELKVLRGGKIITLSTVK